MPRASVASYHSSAPESNTATSLGRRYPIGVELLLGQGGAPCAHARVWAPGHGRLVAIGGTNGDDWQVPLEPEQDGYHAGWLPSLNAGGRYRLLVDGKGPFPDPVSRFQPDGPHGASVLIDPHQFPWTDDAWTGIALHGQVMYELHVGTFTPEGTFASAVRRLAHLRDLGVTCIELMPLAEFSGRFGWGYDGVDLYAPHHLYGTPDDLRAFVDAAHGHGIGVILDVVYNHLGPDGNYLREFSTQYFGSKSTEWGDALNFDEQGAAGVREFVCTNAAYWAEEFHIDGFRLDATQQIFDTSSPHILADIAATVRAIEDGRNRLVVAENEPERSILARSPADGGYGLDALWNDDFHHSAIVAVTGRSEAYYSDFRGTAQELVSAAKYGFLFQGQWFAWQHQRRGTPSLDLHPAQFVGFVENHDQVANSPVGRRLNQETSPGRLRAMTALLLLLPHTPLLFQGQEFASSAPWQFFADHDPDLAALVRRGRHEFLSQFPSVAEHGAQRDLPDPADPETFMRCKLDWSEVETHRETLDLHRDLLRLRATDSVFSAQHMRGLDGAVLAERALVLRFFGAAQHDRLVIVNLGGQVHVNDAEPLLASPTRLGWRTVLSTEHPRYGGWGVWPLETDDGWWLPAESATVLIPNNVAPPVHESAKRHGRDR